MHGMSDSSVPLSSGVPETVLDAAPAAARAQLDEALAAPEAERRDRLAAVAVAFPRFVDAWAELGACTRDPIEAYAYFRVGYHRGLDGLRQAGWRGSGYVRWRHPSNRGFLRALDGLRRQADAIGEADEAQRCADFLRQLDPEWGAGPVS
jgi:hypothetical protein